MAYAQTEGGSGGESGGGLDTKYKRNTGNCTTTIIGTVSTTGTIWGIFCTIPTSGSITITRGDWQIWCDGGGNSTCTPRDC